MQVLVDVPLRIAPSAMSSSFAEWNPWIAKQSYEIRWTIYRSHNTGPMNNHNVLHPITSYHLHKTVQV